MKYLRKYNESIDTEVKEYLSDIELSLIDVGLHIRYDVEVEQGSKLSKLVNIDNLKAGIGRMQIVDVIIIEPSFKSSSHFTLAQIKDEVNHIISYLEDNNYELISASYLKDRLIEIYNINNVNRWGVKQQKHDIFDIQDVDLTKEKSRGFKLIVKKIK
jgi:hypothetical protein